MTMTSKLLLLLFSLLSLGFGTFVFLKPALVIRMQQIFYAHINWRMEPIDMKKELRNTRIMGAFLVGFVVVIAALVFRR